MGAELGSVVCRARERVLGTAGQEPSGCVRSWRRMVWWPGAGTVGQAGPWRPWQQPGFDSMWSGKPQGISLSGGVTCSALL